MKNKTVLAGVLIVLAALLLVLFVALWPRVAAKKEMAALLSSFSEGDLQYITVTDPLFATGDLLGNKGKEIVLDAGDAFTVREGISKLANDFSFLRKERKSAGGWDLRIMAKTAAGESVQLFFAEEGFYYMDGSTAFFFEAKDAEAYGALRAFFVERIAQSPSAE